MKGHGQGGYRTPVITIISNKMDPEDVFTITERATASKQQCTHIRMVRYKIDYMGIFYFSQRYDKNYTHLWEE
jgi:hypothetical protein